MSTTGAGRGPGRPRKIGREQQRDLVLRAATTVFAQSGLDAATIERIAREAGTSRQSVYEIFGDKTSLFDAAVADAQDRAYSALSREVLQPPEEDLAAVARRGYAGMFAFVADQPDAYELLHVAERAGDPAMTRLCRRRAPRYTQAPPRRWELQGIASGRADDALVAMYFAMTESLVTLSRAEGAPDRTTLIDLLTEFTVGGVSRVMRRHPEIIERLR